jgi:hypothetical protein
MAHPYVNVNLTGKAEAALLEITLLEGVSKTDAVNRSIQIWAFLLKEQEQGHYIVLKRRWWRRGRRIRIT